MTKMAPEERHITTGRIIAVQEQRFRLLTVHGQGLLLTLAHNAGAEMQTLRQMQTSGAWVEVEYSGAPNLASGVAHRVTSVAGR